MYQRASQLFTAFISALHRLSLVSITPEIRVLSGDFDQETNAVRSNTAKVLDCFLIRQRQATLSRIAIQRFLTETKIVTETLEGSLHGVVAERVASIVKTWDIGGFDRRKFEAIVETSLNIATLMYGHTPVTVQVYACLYAVTTISVDDFACSQQAMEEFAPLFYAGRPQLHPILDRLVDLLHSAQDHFAPLAANEIVRATLAAIYSSALEFKIADAPIRPGMLSYVVGKRLYNGNGKGYGLLIWDKSIFPDVCSFIQALP